MIKYVKTAYSEIANIKFTEIPHPEFAVKLAEYESQLIVTKYKFGLLYVKEGQTNEDDMFSNTEMSKEMEEFMELLGTKIELKGWTAYRGGLNVTNNATGTHSIYTKFRGEFEIMFHGMNNSFLF
jgi:RAP1 GTPase activating protein 1